MPTWGKAAAAVASVAADVTGVVKPAAQGQLSEEEAKKAWLAKLDTEPSWKTKVAGLGEACDQGVNEACDTLQVEAAAKAAWLASLDGSVKPSAASGAMTAEEKAKAEWLAKRS